MADNSVSRKLVAILSADVVGYSRLMEADEAGTLAALKAHRSELIEPKIADYHGRTVKTTGDGFLIEFPSIVEAVQCAIDLQTGMSERNADTPDDLQFRFRVGINVGDVMIEDDDIFGDGVNVAARLQEIAEPGEVYISRSARDQIRDKLDVPLEDLGERQVKNIARPVRVFRVQIESSQTAPSPAQERTPNVRPQASEQKSIAVLPFENMSGDPEQEYFADGIAEDLITALSKVSELFVIARNSTFTYKGQAVKVEQVSDELGVKFVLEGSVRKAGNRVRITAQLIDGGTGGHLWAERYDRDLEDIFAVQDEVTQQIVSSLEVTLKAGESQRLASHETDDVNAYDCLLRGRELFMRFTQEDNLRAREAFQKSLEIDPDCAPAYARLAQTYLWESRFEGSVSTQRSAERAAAYVRKALSLDEALPFAHGVMGNIHLWAKDYDQAISEMVRWIELDPNEADAYVGLANTLNFAGRAEDALPLLDKSMRLNPHYGFLTLFALGQAQFMLGKHVDAIKALERSIVHNPNFIGTKFYLPASYAEAGDIEKAQELVATLERDSPDLLDESIAKVLPFKRSEDFELLMNALKKAGLST